MDMINFDGLLIGIVILLIIGFSSGCGEAGILLGTKCGGSLFWRAGTVASLKVFSSRLFCGRLCLFLFLTIKEVFEQERARF